ncbi:SH3 and cysteine-rich domain-containing protein 3-like [Petromyzon marinus]|uniref:SH3 and cysteine-rich domain-containing protein 3-like n=2 Tax=Petromyzon marinus TaxID=7757 RepID=A0AAJ7THA3_PETMA|nr:SH3 and cysteine-rich domain-containing protein 3-like [Petromyzon marinus]
MIDLSEKENDPLRPCERSAMNGHAESPLQRLKKSLSLKPKVLNKRNKSSQEGILQCSRQQQQQPPPPQQQQQLLPSPASSGDPEVAPQPPSPTYPRGQPGRADRTHTFQEHSFKKPTFCDVCNHMIVGSGAKPQSKMGVRCRACKMSAHHRCQACVSQQCCVGKMPKGFRRHYTSPLLLSGRYACIKEVMPLASGNKLDPVYEALRYGTSLAQRGRSKSEADDLNDDPNDDPAELPEVPEEADADSESSETARGPDGGGVFHTTENGLQKLSIHEQKWGSLRGRQAAAAAAGRYFGQAYTYVVLYKFVAQEKDDLQLTPGQRLIVIDDSNEEWWKGKMGDKLGYFPANFVIRVRAGERVLRLSRTFVGNKQLGQITLKQGQVCVEKGEECNGFLKVTSGRKLGLVALDYLEEI